MNKNRCINCGSLVFDDGFCGNVNCNTYYSQWDTGPAPKEKEMDPYDPNVSVEELREENYKQAEKAELTYLLESVWERAYLAALQGLMPLATQVDCGIDGLVRDAAYAANAAVSAWPAMTAERDALIAKAVES